MSHWQFHRWTNRATVTPAMGPEGEITVSMLGERIIECRARGHLRHEHAVSAQTEIESICDRTPGVFHSLFDGTAIDSFERGLPIRWVRWGARFVHRAGRTAIVARPGPMLGLASTIRYLLPDLSIALFADHAAALAFLQCANDVLDRH